MTAAGRVPGRRSDFRALGEWRRVRRVVLARDGRRCRVRLLGCRGVANEVDHIVPVADGGARLDPANLRASCGWCNKHRTGAGVARGTTVFHVGTQ